MCVHLFGATSSPSCANFALRRCAEDNSNSFSQQVVDTIMHSFYVDDCLVSVPSESEAVALYHDLRAICTRGGFQLKKWISNSRNVLAAIPEEERAVDVKELDLDHDTLPVERVLVVQWCVQSDAFKFKISIQERPLTRRGILSVVSSIYDPLGVLVPVVLKAKLILQDLCRKGLGWDDVVPTPIALEWTNWIEELHLLQDFKISRCLKPMHFGTVASAQLHHFSDASEMGYGIATYLLLRNTDGKLCSTLVMGKARVAPLKPITIPRLELTAAVVAARMDRLWRKELQMTLLDSVFWTDSTSVLKYVKNETSRFKTFVANRVAEILKASYAAQWRYVNTLSNPADIASRGLGVRSFLKDEQWMCGPQFLLSEEQWPTNPDSSEELSEQDDPEFRMSILTNAVSMPEESKHPIILTKDLQISDLILRQVHKEVGHGGRTHMLAKLRQKYWITGASVAIRKILAKCVVCRRVLAVPASQQMADLPLNRISPDEPPFTSVGVDCFGPFEVKRGRSKVKRYGVIFTCLALRAVHIEVAASLETDSFINTLRRFIARRGQVKELCSDNGTNFVGADRELKRSLEQWNQSQIHDELLQKGIKWKFNPPSGSHHGGAWERLIRSIRKVLNSTLRVQTLDDDGLHTAVRN